MRHHLDVDLPKVMETIRGSIHPPSDGQSIGGAEEAMKEAEAACRCAEKWILYGLGGE